MLQEQTLDASATTTATTNRRDLTHVPELTEYLKYLKPKKLAFNNFKRAYFTFRDLSISYFNSAQEANGPPLGHYCLKGCEVMPDVSASQGKYQIKLQIPTSEGATDLVLKCDSEQQYAKWMAACKLASRGKSMADGSYGTEVESLKRMLQMQAGRNQNGSSTGGGGAKNGQGGKKQAPPVQLPSDFNVEEFVPQRYVKKARSKQALQQRISDAHSNVRTLTSIEV